MSDIKQEAVFVDIGIDSDTDSRYISNGDCSVDYPNLNILVSEDGAIGTITNSKGNSLAVNINDFVLNLADTYTTLGSYYNRLTRKVYYIVFSSTYDSGGGVYLYDNKLFCFSEDTETLDLILTDTANYFGLDLNYPMRDMKMIGDWLYFTPRVSEPKMIDVVMAYNFTHYNKYVSSSTYIFGESVRFNGGIFVANTSVAAGETPATAIAKWDRIGNAYMDDPVMALDSEFRIAFNVIKMPPLQRPFLSIQSDATRMINNVRGKVFRFAYRYKYFDDSYSVYSAYSDITLPEDDEYYNGEIFTAVNENNYVQIEFSPHSPALIKSIELVYQETGSEWKRIAVIDRQEQTRINYLATPTLTHNFYNDESYLVVDSREVANIYDSVPQKANAEEIINLNRLAYGGVTEGFANIDKSDLDITLIPVAQSISIPLGPGTVLRDNNLSGDITLQLTTDNEGNTRYGEKIDLTTWSAGALHQGDTYTVRIDGRTEQYILTAADEASISHLAISLRTFFLNKYALYDTRIVSPDDLVIWAPLGVHHMDFIEESVFSTAGTVVAELTKKRGFKTGSMHPFCLFYYDQSLRRWDAQVEEGGTKVYVPLLMEDAATYTDTNWRFTIDWEIGHLPPAGAKYWRWGYAGNSLCSWFVQYVITSAVQTTDPLDGENMIKINITPYQTLQNTTTATWNQYPNSVLDAYEWVAGDRLRFMTEQGTGTTLGDVIDGVYDFEIIKQDETGMYVFIQDFSAFSGLSIGLNSLVEIYRPLKSVAGGKTEYFEFGDLMSVIEDTAGVMVHGGRNGIENQDTFLGTKALGSFDAGDIYHIVRTPSQPINVAAPTTGFFHETMGYSDFYPSVDWDKGKIGIETTFGQRFLNLIRYSNQYLQNTMINGLSTFAGDALKDLNDIYGQVVAMYEIGDTLKVYQERKASSILIGRTEYYDSQGNYTVSISDKVLGAIRYSPSNYSTVFPESLAVNNRYIYGFDIYNGVVWRDSVNGMFPISGRYAEAGADRDYKMMSYFKAKSKALLEAGIDHIDVMGVWDEEFKMFYIIFKDKVYAQNNEALAFHEPSNRWISFYSLTKTDVLGYDTPLSLDYEVIRGFSAGIGHVYNDSTGFDEFDFGTAVSPESMYPNDTIIVDNTQVDYITSNDGRDYIITTT